VYRYNGAQWYEQFFQVGRLDRALILLGLSSKHLCMFGLFTISYLKFFVIFFALLSGELILIDWPLTWLTNHRPSVL